MLTVWSSEKIQKVKIQYSGYIYQNELDNVCFQHDMAYGGFQVLDRRTAGNKAFNIAKSPKYDGYQHGLAWIIIFWIKKL